MKFFLATNNILCRAELILCCSKTNLKMIGNTKVVDFIDCHSAVFKNGQQQEEGYHQF